MQPLRAKIVRFAWQSFITAIQFLTRIPVPGGMNRPHADVRLLLGAVPFFPLIGGLIGTISGGCIVLALHLWPMLLAVLIGLAVEAIVTGAFHEDAVADTCDAFGGGWSVDDVLRILKDSRIGSYGALGLGLAVSLRAAGLSALDADTLLPVAIASAALGRWAILILMLTVPPVPQHHGLSKDVGAQIGVRECLFGTMCMAFPCAWWFMLAPSRAALALLLVFVWALLWGRYVRGRIGGITGDGLGAGCYAAQLVVLLVAAAKISP